LPSWLDVSTRVHCHSIFPKRQHRWCWSRPVSPQYQG